MINNIEEEGLAVGNGDFCVEYTVLVNMFHNVLWYELEMVIEEKDKIVLSIHM